MAIPFSASSTFTLRTLRSARSVSRAWRERACANAAPPDASLATPGSVDIPGYSLNTGLPTVERTESSTDVGLVGSTNVISSSPFSGLVSSGPVQYYLRQLDENPLVTKCWTSFTGFIVGDMVAQLCSEPTFSLDRALILACYGFFVDAPVGNSFYYWLDRTIEPGAPQTAKAVGVKIAIDQLIYAPILTCVLYAYLQLAHGQSFETIVPTLQDKVVPTMLANYAIWPLAHALNFYYVPTEQRILYNNFVAVVWTTVLSYLAH